MSESELSEIMYEVCDRLNIPLTHEESELIMHYAKAIEKKLEANQDNTVINDTWREGSTVVRKQKPKWFTWRSFFSGFRRDI